MWKKYQHQEDFESDSSVHREREEGTPSEDRLFSRGNGKKRTKLLTIQNDEDGEDDNSIRWKCLCYEVKYKLYIIIHTRYIISQIKIRFTEIALCQEPVPQLGLDHFASENDNAMDHLLETEVDRAAGLV